MLYSIDELRGDFDSLCFHILEEKEININQEKFHQGKAIVVRVLAIKI